MSASLTRGAILRTYNNDTTGNPTVQIIDIKKLNSSGSAQDRYRLVISDSVHYQQAMLNTQLNNLIETGQLSTWCVVTLREHICSTVADRKIVIVLQLEVSPGPQPSGMIGTPTNVDQAAQQTPKPAAPPPQQSRYQAPPQQSSYQAPQSSYQPQRAAPPQQFGGNQAESFHPISSLNPYRNRWTIKARVTAKGDMRTWTNAKGEGKLFSVDLLDNQGGQIRATMFNDVADKFYPIFQADKVYVISKGTLKLANKRYNRLPNEYEITLNNDAEVTYYGEDNSIELQKFDFCSIERLQRTDPDQFIDLVGVATQISPMYNLVSKSTGRDLKKRTLTVVDSSMLSVDITLWGELAEKYNESMFENQPVIAAKALRVSDFGGRSLNTGFTSLILINPEIKQAQEMRQWYETKGRSGTVTSISESRSGGSGAAPRKTFAAIKDENLGFKEKPDYFSVRGTITFFQHDPAKPPWYNACPAPKCNKKVIFDDGSNTWNCEKCQQSYPNCDPRYILRLLACDATGSEWLTAFNDAAEPLIGRKAAEMNDIKEADRSQYEQQFQSANFRQYIFKIRAKAETVQDATQVKCHILAAEPINFRQESQFLLDAINAFN
jgi:replication factor A1